MATAKTLALRAIRVHPRTLGEYINKIDASGKVTEVLIRDRSKPIVSLTGEYYRLLSSGALVRSNKKRMRGRKPHPRRGTMMHDSQLAIRRRKI